MAADSAQLSQYKPESGFLLGAVAGIQWRDYLGTQAEVVWNRNRLGLISADGSSFYEDSRRSRQVAVAVMPLVYFRGRTSWVRPYLGAGAGVRHFRSSRMEVRAQRGVLPLPPAVFSATGIVFPVAAGIDLRLRPGWVVRYSFTETIGGNPISRELVPRGKRKLAHFQNLFGILRTF